MMAGVLANFGPNSQTIMPVWPTFPTRCSTGWLLPLLDLLPQLPRMVLKTTTNLLDQEDCYSISLLKNFVRVIFTVTDNYKNF